MMSTLTKKLKRNKKYNLVMHKYADPDTYASAVGMSLVLEKLGVGSQIISLDSEMLFEATLKSKYGFEVGYIYELKDHHFDLPTIFLDSKPNDTNTTDRFRNVFGIIDHHDSFNFIGFRTLEFVDIRNVGSCVSIVLEYMELLEIPMTEKFANLAYMGIYIDTRGLTSYVKDLDIDMLPWLLRNVNYTQISEIINNNLTLDFMSATRNAFGNMKVVLELEIAILDAGYKVEPKVLAEISEIAIRIDSVANVLIFSCLGDVIKYSVRTEKPYSRKVASLVMSAIGGDSGGKLHEAGGTLPNRVTDKEISDAFVKAIREVRS